jgi:pimeloyl-ACP methyl ester carboxylesterase
LRPARRGGTHGGVKVPILAPPVVAGPRFLYLHGFASGRSSHKGLAVCNHYDMRGVPVDRLNLRVPSIEHLRLSAMIATTRAAIGGPADRAVLIGSSLGGLTAARVAEQDARVCALVLLAPAFRLVERWRQRLGAAAWEAWQKTGWLATEDHEEKRPARVDYGFAVDAETADAKGGGWPDVRVPVLIIHGREDTVVDIELSRVYKQNRRHVRLVEVNDGHDLAASIDVILREADAFLAPFLGG